MDAMDRLVVTPVNIFFSQGFLKCTHTVTWLVSYVTHLE